MLDLSLPPALSLSLTTVLTLYLEFAWCVDGCFAPLVLDPLEFHASSHYLWSVLNSVSLRLVFTMAKWLVSDWQLSWNAHIALFASQLFTPIQFKPFYQMDYFSRWKTVFFLFKLFAFLYKLYEFLRKCFALCHLTGVKLKCGKKATTKPEVASLESSFYFLISIVRCSHHFYPVTERQRERRADDQTN